MRRTTITAAAAVLLLALTGCSAEDSGSAKEATTSPPVVEGPSKDERFINRVHDADFTSWPTSPPLEELTALPVQWCSELDAGHSVEYLFDEAGLYPIGEKWGTELSEAHELLLIGVDVYCPALRDQVTAELRESGVY
ncbi:hypothetical protein [Streptomyces sp. NPDC001985]|uniref:hypothetical protein n=1 Tax=Streptomyces sp. NPDC001985 TaxID=3154406 RepID=UPI00332B65F3